MLAGLVLSTSIPKAFETRGLAFALAFAGDAGRPLGFYCLVDRRHRESATRMNCVRISVVADASAACSGSQAASPKGNAAGALGDWRLRSNMPRPRCVSGCRGLGASSMSGLGGRGRPYGGALRALHHHRARRIHRRHRRDVRRYLTWTADRPSPHLSSPLLGSLAMWWIYFHMGAEAGSEQISQSRGRRPVGAAGLHLSAYADRGRHRRRRGRTMNWCWRIPTAIPTSRRS